VPSYEWTRAPVTATIISDGHYRPGDPLFGSPSSIAVEADGHLVVADPALQAVLRVDPRTGDRTIISDATTGQGPLFGSPSSIAGGGRRASGGWRILLSRQFYEWTRAPVDRTIISDATNRPGTALWNTR